MDAKWAIYRKNFGQIAVERWFYHWKTILAIRSKSGRNLTIGSWFYRWIKPRFNLGHQMHDHWRWAWFGPLDQRRRDLSHQITQKKNKKNGQKISDFPSSSPIFSIYRRFIVSPLYIIDLSTIFTYILQYFSLLINLHEISCRRPSIHDISSIYPNIFFHAQNKG